MAPFASPVLPSTQDVLSAAWEPALHATRLDIWLAQPVVLCAMWVCLGVNFAHQVLYALYVG